MNRSIQSFARSLLVLLMTLAMSGSSPCKEGVIQCANLIYAGTKTSRCFSDAFLSSVQKETTIGTERRFKSVKLDSKELFKFPFVMMTGESDFYLTSKERENLKEYLAKGGFLLSSAGCSNKEWDRAYRREMRKVFGDSALKKIPTEHPIFRTVNDVKKLKLYGGKEGFLEGVEIDGKLVAVHSKNGLNDTGNTSGCCCCGGSEILNSLEINVNIFAYALLH